MTVSIVSLPPLTSWGCHVHKQSYLAEILKVHEDPLLLRTDVSLSLHQLQNSYQSNQCILSTLDHFQSISQHPRSLSIYLSAPLISFNLSLSTLNLFQSISQNLSLSTLYLFQSIYTLTSIFHPKIDNTADNSSRLYQRSLSTLDPFETISGFDFHLPSKHWPYCRCLG